MTSDVIEQFRAEKRHWPNSFAEWNWKSIPKIDGINTPKKIQKKTKFINRLNRYLECWTRTNVRQQFPVQQNTHAHIYKYINTVIIHINIVHWAGWNEIMQNYIERSMEFNSIRSYLTNIYIASVLCLFAFQWMMIHQWHELKWGKSSEKTPLNRTRHGFSIWKVELGF